MFTPDLSCMPQVPAWHIPIVTEKRGVLLESGSSPPRIQMTLGCNCLTSWWLRWYIILLLKWGPQLGRSVRCLKWLRLAEPGSGTSLFGVKLFHSCASKRPQHHSLRFSVCFLISQPDVVAALRDLKRKLFLLLFYGMTWHDVTSLFGLNEGPVTWTAWQTIVRD